MELPSLWKVYTEQIKITKEKLKPNSDNIIIEKSKVVAKLRNEVSFGYTTISTKKHLPNDINVIDQETWKQLGEVLQEIMQKYGHSRFSDWMLTRRKTCKSALRVLR